MATLDVEDVEQIAEAVINCAPKAAKKGRFSKLSALGFITPLLIVFNVDGLTIEQVTAIITAGGALIAYVLAEGYVDGKRENGKDEGGE